MPDQSAFIVDLSYANWVWEYINTRKRIYWPDDERLTYITDLTTLKTKTWYRDGTWDDRDDTEWHEQTGFGVPDFIGTPFLDFHKGKVKTTKLAGVTYTTIGSWYTFELRNEANSKAVFNPIRLPVTQDMIPGAKEWARSHGGEFVREKGVEFKERFATALDGDEARLAASDLSDVHVRIPVEDRQEATTVFKEATDMAAEAVEKAIKI